MAVAQPLLEVTVVTTNDHAARIRLVGELDMSSHHVLHARVRDLVDEGRWGLAFDLSELSFMDSTGLNAFVEIHKLVLPVGGQVTIENAPPHVAKLFAISGLELVLGVNGGADRATDPV